MIFFLNLKYNFIIFFLFYVSIASETAYLKFKYYISAYPRILSQSYNITYIINGGEKSASSV